MAWLLADPPLISSTAEEPEFHARASEIYWHLCCGPTWSKLSLQVTCITQHKNTFSMLDQDVLTLRILGVSSANNGKTAFILTCYCAEEGMLQRKQRPLQAFLRHCRLAFLLSVFSGRVDSSSLGAKTNVTDWSPNNTTRTKSSSYRGPLILHMETSSCHSSIAIQPVRQ